MGGRIVHLVLKAAKQKKRLKGLDFASLKWLAEFLAPFRTATTALGGQLYPSLPLVVPFTCQLLEHCEAQLVDQPGEEAIRKRALQKVEAKLQPSMKHKMATFLVYDHVRSLLGGERGKVDSPDVPAADPVLAATPPPQKRARVSATLAKWKAPSAAQKDEVTTYLEQAPSVDVEDMYTYWRSELQPITGVFQSSAKVAHRLMGMPATSAASKRSFSRAGFLINCRRNRLAPRTIDNILFLNSYLTNKMRNSHFEQKLSTMAVKAVSIKNSIKDIKKNFTLLSDLDFKPSDH
ncbi:hypothetical protein FOCC_FOCC015076 [Frankliniella occidentalis]|nr:hypothetical protein FOCC_FOCC015076 [Frankliniella occidentalis]